MSCLLHLSDTHFGTEQPEVLAALRRLALAVRPDVLLMSGDITQRATAAQFRAARAFVDSLDIAAVVAIPGNHDIPLLALNQRLFSPYARFSASFGNELEPGYESDDVRVITVNSTRWYRHKNGTLSARQIEAGARRLAQARPGQWRLVMMHHPIAVTQPRDIVNRVHHHAAAIQRWREAGADLVLGGHIHLPYVVPLHRTAEAAAGHASTLRPQRPVWAVQAGTAMSWRVRREAGPSVNVIRTHAGVHRLALVERWDHIEPDRGFERVSVHDFTA